jgi:hypothetical protein
MFRWCSGLAFLAAASLEMTALNQDSEDLPGIGEIHYRGQRGASGR